MTVQPTRQAFEELEKAYSFFNEQLFEGQLPECMLTLQRQHDTYGYFTPNSFQNRTGERAHEIALNPSYFSIRSIPETLSTLVTEMVSLRQWVITPPDQRPRRRYRNKHWAAMAKEVGLMPSSTGLPGGSQTGDKVRTYIIDGGAFDLAASKLVDEHFTISWLDRYPPAEEVESLLRNQMAAQDVLNQDEVSRSADPAPGPEATSVGADERAQHEAFALAEEGSDGLVGVSLEKAHSDEPGASLPVDTPQGKPDGGGKPPGPAMKVYAPAVPLDELKDQGIEPKDPPKSANKTKFSCSMCAANAWGKVSLRIQCVGAEDAAHEPVLMDIQPTATKNSSSAPQ